MNSRIGFLLGLTVLLSIAATGYGLKCYVCMGRDSDNCKTGETSCNGYCYKVEDKAHDLIVKGCTTDREVPVDGSELSDWKPKPHISLYWTTDADNSRDYVRGRSYFCPKDFCNSASSLVINPRLASLSVLTAFLIAAFLLRL